MRYLILGGTQFVGRHITRVAIENGHEVTLFTRGRTNPDLFPHAEHLIGDRDGDLYALEGREWDRVIDVSGYVPAAVGASAELLRDATEHYTFISTISVYPSFAGVSEDSDVLPPATGRDVTADSYGPLKAACEDIVRDEFGRRALVVRPGWIVGPRDHTDRFTYWVSRIARGGDIVAPGFPQRLVQVVDARDLAEWAVDMAARRRPGVYNATGPDYRLTFARMLDRIRAVTGADATFHWVPDDKIDDELGARLPLWERGDGTRPFDMDVDNMRARWEGLVFRPLAETITDTLEWERSRHDGSALATGPGDDAERHLVARATQRT